VRFSRKRQDGFAPNFIQGTVENTYSLQPALKSSAPGLVYKMMMYMVGLYATRTTRQKRNIDNFRPCIKKT